MKWNDKTGYITYKVALQNIKSYLGISEIDYFMRCELAPYITYILDYISKRLVLLSEDSGIKEYIQEVFTIREEGESKIIYGAVDELRSEVGIDNGEIYVENSEIPYVEDRFIYSWSNIMTALIVRIKFQYAGLLAQNPNNDCPCGDTCYPGQTIKDFESWTSGVYPEDEEYSYYNYKDVTSTDWRVNNDIPECTKCLRGT